MDYFNCVEIEEKVVWSFVPRLFTTAMMATEIPAAIRPYSMAVAPASSARNWRTFAPMAASVGSSSESSVKVPPVTRRFAELTLTYYPQKSSRARPEIQTSATKPSKIRDVKPNSAAPQ